MLNCVCTYTHGLGDVCIPVFTLSSLGVELFFLKLIFNPGASKLKSRTDFLFPSFFISREASFLAQTMIGYNGGAHLWPVSGGN